MSSFLIKARTKVTVSIMNLENATKVMSGNIFMMGLHLPSASYTRKQLAVKGRLPDTYDLQS